MQPFTLADWLKDRLRERGLSQQQRFAHNRCAASTGGVVIVRYRQLSKSLIWGS
jgi:hypothetical protein